MIIIKCSDNYNERKNMRIIMTIMQIYR